MNTPVIVVQRWKWPVICQLAKIIQTHSLSAKSHILLCFSITEMNVCCRVTYNIIIGLMKLVDLFVVALCHLH